METIRDLIEFAEVHAPTWNRNASTLNLSTLQVNTYTQLTQDARTSYDSVVAAKQALANAVLAQRQAVRDLRSYNGALLRAIRSYAEQQPKPDVIYIAADIPAPRTPAPLGPPSAPFDPTAGLDLTLGGIRVSWKATQPQGMSGVVYRIERNTGTGQAWQLAGLVGGKNFVDDNVPTTQTVQYRIIAQRGNLASNPSQTLVINFGTGPGMTFTLASNDGESKKAPKLAA